MLTETSVHTRPELGAVAQAQQPSSSVSSRWKWVLYAAAGIGIVLALKYFHVQDLLKSALEWIGNLGPWGPVIFVGLYVVATVLFVPGSVLTLGAGAVFGVAPGSVYVSIGATLGATAAFLVGRYLARDAIARKIEKHEKFATIDRAVADEGWKIVLLTRLAPVFPFILLNYSFGLTRVKLSHYVLASWLGMIPGTVMYVYLGSLVNLGAGHRQRTTGEWILYGVGLLATVAVTVFVTRLARNALAKKIGGKETTQTHKAMTSDHSASVTVTPADAHNKRLVSHVHPPDWRNPAPAPCYNLVVIGAGTAGLVTAAGAAGLGAKVALIEKGLLGGDCLNVGCVPSKAIIRSGRAVFDAKEAGRFGVRVGAPVETDFAAVMERMRKLRADLSPHDSAQRFAKLGVDVFLGEARFAGPDTIVVGGQTLRFKRAVIATGARAVEPPIPGLAEAGYLTNETVFNLTQCPARLAVIGGGPIGCELAQAFQRLGSQVTLLHKNAHLLDREDMDAAALVQKAFVREGIALSLNATIARVESSDGGNGKVIYYQAQGKEETLAVDEILIGTGRAPNVEGLNLEAVGVQYDRRKGVLVNDRLQTTNPRIYAAGDVCLDWKFTHAADFSARIVIQNALFLGRKKASALTMPWCTYTDPEIAHVGLYERDARERGIEVDTYVRESKQVDRAVLDGEEDGFVKFHVRKGGDEILGATIVARHAGEMISEISVAMAARIRLGKLASVIHPYPTQAEAIRQCGDAYNRTRLTPTVKKWMAAGWPGKGPEATRHKLSRFTITALRAGGRSVDGRANGGLACVSALATIAIFNEGQRQQYNCLLLSMKRFAILLATLASLTPALAQGQISAPASAKFNVKRDIAYAEPADPRQKVDIYAPEGARNLPVVFWIHGGGWQTGDRTNVQVKPQAFVDKGFVFVSTGYRLLTNVEMATIFSDIAKSVRWVHDHIGDYGGDPKRLLVMGHSAGAQLAALICIDDRYLKAEGLSLAIIKGCVPVDGDTYDVPAIIETAETRHRVHGMPMPTFGHRIKFGNDPAKHRDYSAVTHVAKGKGVPPFLILHVADHPDVSAQAQRLESVLKDAGIPAKRFAARETNHNKLNENLGLPDDPPTQALFEFVDDALKK